MSLNVLPCISLRRELALLANAEVSQLAAVHVAPGTIWSDALMVKANRPKVVTLPNRILNMKVAQSASHTKTR
jgi:hypothetical protein